MYAVQRIYEMADKWKRDRDYINSEIIKKKEPHKPDINPIRSDTHSTRSRTVRNMSPDRLRTGGKKMTSAMKLDAMQDGDGYLQTEPDYAHTLMTEPDNALATEPDRPDDYWDDLKRQLDQKDGNDVGALIDMDGVSPNVRELKRKFTDDAIREERDQRVQVAEEAAVPTTRPAIMRMTRELETINEDPDGANDDLHAYFFGSSQPKGKEKYSKNVRRY